MKVTIGVQDLSEETLLFAKQFGVTHLKVNAGDFMDERQRGPVQRPKLVKAKERIESHGLRIGVGLLPQGAGTQHWNIRLGRPERDREIEDVCRSIEILGAEDIPVVEYVFNLSGVFGSETKPSARGGALTRYFDYDRAKQAPPEPEFKAGEEAVWERITYFLEHVVPVAERAGVKLACHPDDPPVPTLKGETRVLGSLEGMKRLIETVPSEVNGLNFCQGTVAEMGVDVIAAIRYFGSRGKIHHVHFRNVKGFIPRFDESFIDDGDVDMLEAMRAYKEVGYTGTIMPDHTPRVAGDGPGVQRGIAFALGYIKALMRAVDASEE
ncbi:MAG: mannonate dehydratase [Candidatus Latescibacteria bacterium]|nr:mannonate dehydratase [Candidatus Latescibacterota bacterium]